MNKLFYPAVFHKAEEGGFWITFPDLPECMTQGDTLEEAYAMAIDALGLCLADMEKSHAPLPEASVPNTIELGADDFLMLVEFDMLAYKKRTNPSFVKKTLSIPGWLNEEALALNVNFSQVLQEALTELVTRQRA